MSDTKPQTVSEVCDAAADVIEREGLMKMRRWNRSEPGAAYDGGPVCTIGGICVATGHYENDIPWDHVEVGAAAAALCDYLEIDSIPFWNDQLARTADEVVQALRDTATKNRPDVMHGGTS